MVLDPALTFLVAVTGEAPLLKRLMGRKHVVGDHEQTVRSWDNGSLFFPRRPAILR
jgi:hypothetical protein